MKLKNNKKGFTLVELVIVIAVIAVLAAVLIPTFGAVINNAQKRAVDSEASNLKTGILVEYATEGDFDKYCEWALTQDALKTEFTIDTKTDSATNPAIYKEDGAKFGDYVSDGTKIKIEAGQITVSTSKYKVVITANSISEADDV